MNAGEQFIVNNVIGYLQVNHHPLQFLYERMLPILNTNHHDIVTYRLLSYESSHSTSYHLFRAGMLLNKKSITRQLILYSIVWPFSQ